MRDLIQAFIFLIYKFKRFKVAGNYLSNNYQYILVSLTRCSGTNCQSSEVIDNVLKRTLVTVIILNSYMDFNDFNTPIKTYIEDSNYFYLSSDFSKITRIYLKQNEANLNDDYLRLSSPLNKAFFSTDKTIVDTAPPFVESIFISILLGPNKDTYTRTVYSIMDLFGNVGGIYGLLQSACGFVVGFISYQILLSSVFRRLYFVNRLDDDSSSAEVIHNPKRVDKLHEESKHWIPRTRILPMLSRQDESKSHSDINIQLSDNNISS